MKKKSLLPQVQILVNQFNAKNYNHVISKSKLLIKENPEQIILYNLLGSSYQSTGDYLKAKETFSNGLKFDFNNISLKNNLAMSYKNLLEYRKAEEIYIEILNQNKNYINAYINLGNLKRDLNQFEKAIDLYSKALKINDNNPIIHYSLALAYQGIGKFELAIKFAKKTLEINQNFTRADHLISQSTKYDTQNSHYLELKKKLNNKTLVDDEKADLYFALAKAEEDKKKIDEACKYLIKGNDLKKRNINYNISKEINFLNEIKSLFENIDFTKYENNEERKIIFILGMPRSGTSLVEQIITSHSQVFGGGELPILSGIVKKNFIKKDKLDKDNLHEILNSQTKINLIKEDYDKFIYSFKFKEKVITDKAPLNFRWIGFIKIFFPNSTIINCTRDPKDNCLSMYKNLFEGGLNFTYDQNDLIKYYKNYMSMMIFWNKLFPKSIYEVKYEKLINNKEEEIRKIIRFCNLTWEDNCLAFHKNKTPIKTMSTAQARQPIYKSSVKSFDKFKNYLDILDKF